MLRSPLLWRLYAGYVVIILICTLIVGTLVGRQVTANSTNEIHHSLAVRSELLAEVARPSLLALTGNLASGLNDSNLQKTIVQLGKNTESRLTIISRSGIVLADSQEQPEIMDNHGNRPEIILAKESGFASQSRFSQTLQQQMIYRALRVEHNQEIIGYVRVSLPLSIIAEKLSQLRLIVLFAALVAACTALVTGFFFARRFTAPLRHMTEVAEAISQGDYNKRLSVTQNDEVGQLANAFNRMARRSEQRMTEITEDRNRLATIFAGMVEGVIHVDQEFQVIHMNEAAARLLDLSALACVNKPFWENVRDREINEALMQAMESNQVVKTQLRRATDGNDRVIDLYVAALSRGHTGESIGAIIVLHDISELDGLERIRRDFVANASHELKTPITAIRGLTETILDDAEMDELTRKRFIKKIHVQSLRLSALVSDLMTISRLESSSAERHYEPIDLAEIIKRSASSVKNTYQEKQQKFDLDVPSARVMISGDMQAISQLIDNLLDNAVKYTPLEGSISVQLSVVNKLTKLTVKDTGIGISAQYQQRIFERFYRVDKARSRELGGTGLGLSIVRNIAEQHGGTIAVESRPGSGSIFTLMLPLL